MFAISAVVLLLAAGGCLSQTNTTPRPSTSPPNCNCQMPSWMTSQNNNGQNFAMPSPPPICTNQNRNFTSMCDLINAGATNQNLGFRPCQFFNSSNQGVFPGPMMGGSMNFSASGFPMPTSSGAFQQSGFGQQYQTTGQGFNGMQGGQFGMQGGQFGNPGFNGMQSSQFSANQGFNSGNQGFMMGPPPAGMNGGQGMNGPPPAGMGGMRGGMMGGMGGMMNFSKAVCLTNNVTMNNTMQAIDQFLQQNPSIGIRCKTACPCTLQCPPDFSQYPGPPMMMF
ncbi:keratin, type I cytoskeletal 9-like [Paramacrobiotus metropolitanus]|uniref:keratin, type I cytoskeletal 9-like n=1 Tax=Paramacrobiotus metropolitanus TaxID=2943436 RepID=UPI0024459299|nr:keratin, type I cytoskeletal 9-like [Paramacrobiotus metropolitanus]